MSHSDWPSHVSSILGAAGRPLGGLGGTLGAAAQAGPAAATRNDDDLPIMRVVAQGDRQLMRDVAAALHAILGAAAGDLRQTCTAAGDAYYTYKVAGYEQELVVDDVVTAVRTVCADRIGDIYVDCEARAIAVRVLCNSPRAAAVPRGARAALHVRDVRDGRRFHPRHIGERHLIRRCVNLRRIRATVDAITRTIEEHCPSEGVHMRAQFVPVTASVVGLRIFGFRRRVPLMIAPLADLCAEEAIVQSVRFHPRDGYLLFLLHMSKRRRESGSEDGADEPGVGRDYMVGRRIVRSARRRPRARTRDEEDDLSLARLFEPPPSQRGAAGDADDRRPRQMRRTL